MKQKIIYIVFLMIAMYLPASSKECGKVLNCTVAKCLLQAAGKTAVKTDDVTVVQTGALPASPFSRLVFNL